MSEKEQNTTQVEAAVQEPTAPSDSHSLNSDASAPSSAVVPDVQVKTGQTAPRRKFTVAYKLKILNDFEACPSASDRGALLRKEGLYHARICTWRKQRDDNKLNSTSQRKPSKSMLTNQRLARDNANLQKQLARAATIIEIQKKVSELFGTNTPVINTSEISS